MSERKVLNKYYPPDFDPSKVPKLRLQRERQYTVRTMAPFNMRCNTCGDYIYQGKKFNAKTENVQDETYIGLRIYRFYIRCPKCISEISFKTDPENEDYTLEHGATRLFEAAKMLRKAAEQEKKDREEEEANNPMKVLENRTKDSKLEMEIIENLEELRELNTRKADIDYAEILRRKAQASEEMMRKQEEEDEAFVRELFGKPEGGRIKRLADDDGEEGESSQPGSSLKSSAHKRPSDVLISDEDPSTKKARPQEPSKSKFGSRSALAGLVKVKKPAPKATAPPTSPPASTNSVGRPSGGSHSAPEVLPDGERGSDSLSARTDAAGLRPPPLGDVKAEPAGSQGTGEAAAERGGAQDDSRLGGDLPEATGDSAISSSIQEGLSKKSAGGGLHGATPRAKSVGLSLLGGYAVSDDSDGSDNSDS